MEKQTKKILEDLKEIQPQLRAKFWATILEILREDASQSCINSEGTKLRFHTDCIEVMGSLSADTIRKLMKTDYLLDCNEQGHLTINHIRIRNYEDA